MKKSIVLVAMAGMAFLPAQAQIDPYDTIDTFVSEVLDVSEEVPSLTGWLSEFDPYSDNFESVPEYAKTRVPRQGAWQYPDLREADVAWMTRYERVIDTRQKQNILLRHPKLNVFDMMLKLALQPDGIKVYADREFKEELTDKQVLEKLQFQTIIRVMDPVTFLEYDSIIYEPIPKESLVKIRMMEDWIFDKKHSSMGPRIVALSILYQPVIANGAVQLPDQPLFWIKYEDLRGTFINSEVFNKNMAARISMDHFFQARMFDSYIVKEPNVYDLDIRFLPEYEDNGIAALLKSDDIENDLFITEHDLWEY